MTAPFSFYQKSPAQIKADVLRVIAAGLKAQGIASPNVGPNSDYDLIATALANELAVVQANNVVIADKVMPDTATGSDLDRWLAVLGLARKQAVGASGFVAPLYNSSSTSIAAGAQLTDTQGLKYQVTVAGVYGTLPGMQSIVPIQAIDTGANTNHAIGDTLTWVSAPPFCGPTVTVATAMSNGSDSEVGLDSGPRSRLLARFANPPGGGNWPQVAQWCSDASPYVAGAAIYPALAGPGSVYAAVFGNPQTVGTLTGSSKSRQVDSNVMRNTVQPFVIGKLPEFVNAIVMSVVDLPIDVTMIVSIPSATTASPPGPGGGWLDGSPWPQTFGGPIPAPCRVTSVSSPISITVYAATPPFVGARIAWISPLTWSLYTATVLGVSGGGGSYALSLDTPWPGIAVGNIIFPQSKNQAAYVTAIFAAFANLGPGEWAAPGSAGSVRGFRHPLPSLTLPSSLDARFLHTIEQSGPEVRSVQLGQVTASTPTVPPNFQTAPNILVPRNIGMYAS